MKQLFTNFPDGITGLALLMLRGSAVALLATIFQSLHAPAPWLHASIIVVAVAILLGVGTRVAAMMGAAIAVPILLATNCVPRMLAIEQGLDLCGLALLGPGAMSIDARLFGRRRISLPR